jgi:hypothetical protein
MTSIIKLDANEYPIKSVTVFKSNKAEILRVFNISLEVSVLMGFEDTTTSDKLLVGGPE